MQHENFDVQRFPIVSIVIALMISILTFSWFGWKTFHEHETARLAQERAALFERTKGEIIHLDEVLTMTARMGAATADTRWEERYRKFEPQLDAAINNALMIAPEAASAVTSTQDANDQLVAMENSAFELVRVGQSENARTILFSEVYETQKAIYTQGMNEFVDQVHKHLTANLNSARRKGFYYLLAAGVGFLISLAFWINAFFTVRRWRVSLVISEEASRQAHKELQKSRDTLEQTVSERTAQLSQQGADLRVMVEDLSLARDQAEIANGAKSEFLAHMSHELRTPLNAIIGFSDMICDETFGPVGSPKYAEYVTDINASGKHLLAIINDILDLSKIEVRKAELSEQVIEITEVLNDSMMMLRKNIEERDLSLETNISEGLPPISVDRIKVKQALINLFTNAVKFTEPGGTITVDAFINSKGDLVIRIADTGVGIAGEDILKVMEPFSQVGDRLTRQHQGTGLGLPLAKALIELHQGTLLLEREVGKGTTITINLPAERVQDRAA